MEVVTSATVHQPFIGTISKWGQVVVCLGLVAALSITPLMAAETRRDGGQKAGSSASAREADLLRMESGILDQTNKERLSRGLTLLRPSPALTFLARRHSSHMCTSNTLAHESDAFPAGWRSFAQRMGIVGVSFAGENVAFHSLLRTSDAWAKSVTRGWMESPRHRKNMLNPAFRYVGIGIVLCKDSIAWVTQVLAADAGRLAGNTVR